MRALVLSALYFYVVPFLCASEWPFLTGEYEVIGRYVDSDQTYSGTVQILEAKEGFQVIRKINGQTTLGKAKVESSTGDQIPMLKLQFELKGVDYTINYLFSTDLDNDARLSGYVVPEGYAGSRPGKEVLFTWKEGESKKARKSKD